jgi:hypothetical protein
MLTNFDLQDKLSKLSIPIVGIFNKDEFTSMTPRQGYYIVNLDDDVDSQGMQKEGTHWTAFVIEGNKACYMDSFGFDAPRQVDTFLQKYKPYAVSTKHIQNIETIICGSYVLYFIWFIHNNRGTPLIKRFDKFLSQSSHDPKKNRELLQKHLAKLKIDIYQ